MTDSISFLGCATSHLAVLFDMCYENHGISQFQIYKNIPVDGKPSILMNPNNYAYEIFEPNSSFHGVSGEIAFGVTGPWGKFKVYEYFKKHHNVQAEDYMSLIDSGSYVASSSTVGKAVHIQQNVAISSQTTLGFGVCVKRAVSVGHHNTIEDLVEINPGVTVSGSVKIGRGSIIGSGAVIKDGIEVGANSIIGMGSIVTKNIPEGVVAYGNPCKVVRENVNSFVPVDY